MLNKYIYIPIVVLLILSSAANIYFIKNYDEASQVHSNSNEEYIDSLEDELATVKETLSAVTNNTDKSITTKSLQDLTNIEDVAVKFLEHIYNVNPENFAYVKNSARDLMSQELFDTLYASDGLNENKIDFATEVSDIDVYQHTKDKQAIVRYKIYTKQLSTKHEVEENHMMILYFKTKNDGLIVEAIESISDMGAI